MREIPVAVLQFCPRADREPNFACAARLLAESASRGAKIAVLPEMFGAFVPADEWHRVAEPAGGPVEQFLTRHAALNGLFICGGSYVEKTTEGVFYNTMPIVSPDGRIVDRYRKMHLFWTDIPDTTAYDERSYLSSGDRRVVFEAHGFTVAVGLCYDLRFPEFFRLPGGRAVDLYCLPAAFMHATGCAHWEVLVRCRAIENLAYFAAAGTAGCHYEISQRPGQTVTTYGHSMIVSPWGEVLSEVLPDEGIAVASITRDAVEQARARLGALHHIREDLWPKAR